MSIESKAGLFSAAARGAAGLTTGLMNRDEAMLAKKRGDIELQQLNAKEQSGTHQQELQLLKEQNDRLLKEGAKQRLFSAFDLYRSDGNPRHLNAALKENQVLKSAFPDVVSIDKVNPEADRDLLH